MEEGACKRFVDNIDELGFVSGGNILDESQKSIAFEQDSRKYKPGS
jgi:hypothetical protein